MTDPSKLEDLFHAARALPEGPERAAYLDEACGADAELRMEVEALLRQDVSSPDLVEAAGERAGDWIGRYRLLEKIGEGGFGSVWMAEQREPVKRRVALKVIKLGMDTAQVIARFEAERQALALMDHPNIARVFDAGATETGRPYFVMELVSGVTLLEYCDGQRLDTRARLELFASVCNAIQHAHQKGVIHRDIKPTNVLVTLHDGEPVPKVIDFGIAKATNQELTARTLFTGHHQVIGTPAYMSPEQAERSGLDIDTRSDVYSLGVLLYELLTGTTPFSMQALLEEGYEAMMRAIREVDPAKPSSRVSTLGGTAAVMAAQRKTDVKRLGTLLRGDLDWIVMKCLEKPRNRRYDSASGLAADIQRHLGNEPVDARPPSSAYRLRKFVQRHRIGVAAATAVGLAVIGGGLLATLGYVAAAESAELATAAGLRSEGERLGAIATGLAGDDPSLALVLAREGGLLSPGVATRSALLTAMADHIELATLSGHDAYVIDAQFDPTGERLLTVAKEPTAFLWDIEARRVSHRLVGHTEALTGGTFDKAGRRVLTSSEDGSACLFDAYTGALLVRLGEHTGAVHRARFSPDEGRVATGCEDGLVRVFDVASGSVIHSFSGHVGAVMDLRWQPDGRGLASLSLDGALRAWDLGSGQERFAVQVVPRFNQAKYSQSEPWLAISDDGERLTVLAASETARSIVFDSTSGEIIETLENSGLRLKALSQRGGLVVGVAQGRIGDRELEVRSGDDPVPLWRGAGGRARFLDPDGRYVAIIRPGGFVVVDLEVREVLARCRGHRYEVLGLAMSRDQRFVVSTSADSDVRLWDLDRARARNVLRRMDWPGGSVLRLYSSADGSRAVLQAATRDGDPVPTVVANLATGEIERELLAPPGARLSVRDLAASADRLVVQEGDRRVVVSELATGAVLRTIEVPEGRIRAANLSPDGSQLAVRVDEEDEVQVSVYDVASGAQRGQACRMPEGERASRIRCANDGRTLITVHSANLPVLIVWDVATGRELRRGIGHTGHIVDLVVTPDGAIGASRGVDDKVIVWDLASAAIRAICHGVPMDSGSRIALSDDGRNVAVFSGEAVMLFDANSGELLAQGSPPRGEAFLLPGHFTEDGTEIVTPDSELRLWRWPVDPLGASESLMPREASYREVERFRIGTPSEQDERVRAWADSHQSSRAHCAWGDRCLENGDLDAAVEAFARAVELREGCARAYLGQAVVNARRAETAFTARERDLRIDAGLVALQGALEHAKSGQVYSDTDSRLDPLRDDPRFAALLERFRR